jgi:uncharacterized protein YjiS (DUF1127 family)
MISQGLQRRSQDEKKLVVANDVGAATVGVDPPEHRGAWQRFADAFYEARMQSAARQIEQHRDAIALWRRHLAQRKEHLHLVRGRRSIAPLELGAPRNPARGLQALAKLVRNVLIAAPHIIAEWQRRVRRRNELMTLSDSDLHDIRWTRAEVEAEGRKTFWRA